MRLLRQKVYFSLILTLTACVPTGVALPATSPVMSVSPASPIASPPTIAYATFPPTWTAVPTAPPSPTPTWTSVSHSTLTPTSTSSPTLLPTATPNPLRISPANAGQVKETGRIKPDNLAQAAWTADGSRVALLTEKELFLYDGKTLAASRAITLPAFVGLESDPQVFVRYNSQSQVVARCNAIGECSWGQVTKDDQWIDSGDVSSRWKEDPSYQITAVEFSPDGTRLAVGGGHGDVSIYPLFLKPPTGIEIDEWLVPGPFAISFDNGLLAKGGDKFAIRLWEIASGAGPSEKLFSAAQIEYGSPQAGYPQVIAFSPIGHLLAWGSSDYSVRLGDVATGQTIFALPGHSGNVWVVTFSPDGQVLASGSKDGMIKLWDVTAGKLLKTLSANAGPVFSLEFSPDGTKLVSGYKDWAVVWGLQP